MIDLSCLSALREALDAASKQSSSKASDQDKNDKNTPIENHLVTEQVTPGDNNSSISFAKDNLIINKLF